jgi:cation:H+ antiporter
MPNVLKTSGVFLLAIDILAFLFVAFDGALNRWEGAALIACFVGYVVYLYRQHRAGAFRDEAIMEEGGAGLERPPWKIAPLFLVSLAGIVLSSQVIITSATSIAVFFRVPRAIIALTLVALGTSIPEIATCVVAARRKEGAIAVGNILGADIMNVCWVAGASAAANDLTVGRKEILFMFPSMLVIVAAMLVMLRAGYRLTRTKALVMLALYLAYLASLFVLFPPG